MKMQTQQNKNQNKNQHELHSYLNSLVSSVSTENPLDYFNSMYKSINPMAIDLALESAKKILVNTSKSAAKASAQDPKIARVFMNIGGDSVNDSFLQGIIATLLWLPDYIRDIMEVKHLSREEVDTCLKVLGECNLPKVFDAFDKKIDGKTVKINSSSCRHYALFLTAITQWCFNGITIFKNTGEPRSNIEMVRYLTATALNTFPSIPFCSYYVGQCRTEDYAKLAENLTKNFNWTEYMSKEAYAINQPRFQVCSEDAPLVACCNHPFAMLLVGETTNNKTTWLSIFCEGEEFAKLCLDNSLTVNEVKEYVLKTSKEKHRDNLTAGHKIAKFVDKNKLVSQGFQLLHRFEDDGDTTGNI